MSEKISLNYGGDTLNLKKSRTLVAVKLKPGVDKQVLKTLVPHMAEPKDAYDTLGGFRLLNIKGSASDANEALNELRARNEVSVGTHVYETSDDGVPFVPTGQLYVEFAREESPDKIQQLFSENKLQILEARGQGAFIVQVTPGSANPVKTAAILQQSPIVKVAEPDLATPGAIKAFMLPADGLIQEQWHLRNTGHHRGTNVGFKAGADARVVAAWQHCQSLGNPMVVVAVIDDGFDLSHPDLSGDGKIVAPKDFTRNTDKPLPNMVIHGDWHGTACAGVAVGAANGKGVVGAAPNCRLMPVRWGINLTDGQVENWFKWVTDQGAWVVSCSWGAAADVYRLSTRQSRAITRCAQEGRSGLGTVICFAAGNSNHDVNDPSGRFVDGFAIHPDVIAVAACTSLDQRSDYSNYGNEITVCAPSSGAGGWGIATSDVTGGFFDNGAWHEAGYSVGPFTYDFGGTSSACPLVAGICGLLLSIKPTMMATEVKNLIKNTARRIGDLSDYDANGHSKYYGYGCIDACAAVRTLTAGSARPSKSRTASSARRSAALRPA